VKERMTRISVWQVFQGISTLTDLWLRDGDSFGNIEINDKGLFIRGIHVCSSTTPHYEFRGY
jgi:hypothetical protein